MYVKFARIEGPSKCCHNKCYSQDNTSVIHVGTGNRIVSGKVQPDHNETTPTHTYNI